MFPGPYSIVHVTPQDHSDGVDATDLLFGFDTLAKARAALREVAKERGVPLEELAVARYWFAIDGEDEGDEAP